MGHYRRAAMVLLGAMTFWGCDEMFLSWVGGGSGAITSYPTRVGNRWTYNRMFYYYNFRPIDTTYHFSLDTVRFVNTAEITGIQKLSRVPDTAGDSITATVFKSRELYSSLTGYSYYTSMLQGLYLQGYIAGGGVIMPRPAGLTFTIQGHTFGSIEDVVAVLTDGMIGEPMDSIYREFPPLLAIKYPLRNQDHWTYRQNNQPFRIDKETGPMKRDSRWNVRYHEVRWLYDLNHDGRWDDDISGVDWISEKGLIRRTFDLKNLLIVSQNHDSVGFVDVRDESVLESMDVR